jgi:hypothetical protein
MLSVTVDEALKEQFSSRDVTRPRDIEVQEESPVWLEGQPQPSLLAPDLDPRLVDEEASDMTKREQGIQLAEALNPTPDRDMASQAQII